MQGQARIAFQWFREDLFHASLHFKRVDDDRDRSSIGYRELDIFDSDRTTWFRSGSHSGGDKIVRPSVPEAYLQLATLSPLLTLS